MTGQKMKSIFEYDNYRKYLKDVYENSKAENSKFSFRYFSRLAGFQSPNFLKLIIDGRRNFALPGIEKCAKALKFNEEETFFFRNLVLLNQATSYEEKQDYATELLKCKTYKQMHPLKESQFHYLTTWYFVPLREMVNLKNFKEDPEWIAKRLSPPITGEEVTQAIEILLKLGLLERNKKGRLTQSESHLTTGDEVTAACAAQFHRDMMTKAAESIDRVPRERREISAVTLGVSEKNIKIIKEMIQKFRQDVVKVVGQEQDSTRIYQLNFQFFPLAALFEEDVFL